MGLAKLVDAPVLLVGDIDRGGVFAQLLRHGGTAGAGRAGAHQGLVINKFRGDVGILRPGLAMLEEKTHLPVLGVVPYLKADIEDEDSAFRPAAGQKAVGPLDAAMCGCRISPILRILCRWSSTRCLACAMCRPPASLARRIW